jgi:hypothetical protein
METSVIKIGDPKFMEEVKVLPNPDGIWIAKDELMTREQCVKECVGCRNMFSDENRGDVCIPYAFPKAKFRNYFMVKGLPIPNNKEGKKFPDEHYNPCPMATHIKHTTISVKQGKHRHGQQRHA